MLTQLAGECEANPGYMLTHCQKSCGTCGVTDEEELEELIAWKKALHEVGGDETLLETPYGVTQTVHPSHAEGIEEVIRNSISYMEDVIFKDPKYEAVKKTCKNRHSDCALWAYLGECEDVSK